MSFKHIILAMDLSLSSPGFAILALEHNGREYVPIVLESSAIKTRQAAKHGEKLTQIQAEVKRYFIMYQPVMVVREKSFSRFAASTQAIYKVNGVCDLTVYGFGHKEMGEIATTSVKKLVAGSGKASKEEVADAAFIRLQIENKHEYYTDKGVLIDDKTDALAVGLAHYIEQGMIAP